MALPTLSSSKYELTVPSSKTKIEYRPYLVKEEKILMIAAESNDESQMIRAIKDIIRSCTFDKCNAEALTMYDLEYIFTLLRSKSVGEGTELRFNCKECDESNDVLVDLNTVSVSSEPDKRIALTDSIGMLMKFPLLNDAIDDSKGGDIDKVFNIIISCIDSIYEGDQMFDSVDQTREELMAFVEGLNSEQFQKVNNFVTNMPHAYIDVEFKCTKCGEDNDINVKGLANFFK
jgi:hypothetical protein